VEILKFIWAAIFFLFAFVLLFVWSKIFLISKKLSVATEQFEELSKIPEEFAGLSPEEELPSA